MRSIAIMVMVPVQLRPAFVPVADGTMSVSGTTDLGHRPEAMGEPLRCGSEFRPRTDNEQLNTWPPPPMAPRRDLTGPLAEVQQVLVNQINRHRTHRTSPARIGDSDCAYLRMLWMPGCGLVARASPGTTILKDSAPNSAQVVDVTDHSISTNPYY